MRSTLRVSTESGQTREDPSEDYLFMLLEDIEGGDEQFLILERLTDPSGQTYIQAIRNDDGSFRIERREGGPDKRYAATANDMRLAHLLITTWAFELPSVEQPVEWLPLQF